MDAPLPLPRLLGKEPALDKKGLGADGASIPDQPESCSLLWQESRWVRPVVPTTPEYLAISPVMILARVGLPNPGAAEKGMETRFSETKEYPDKERITCPGIEKATLSKTRGMLDLGKVAVQKVERRVFFLRCLSQSWDAGVGIRNGPFTA